MPPKPTLTDEEKRSKAAAYQRDYYQRNKESLKLRDKEPWRKEQLRKAAERYRAKKQEREATVEPARMPLTPEERKERDNASGRRFYERNTELCLQRKKEWRDNNSDRQRELTQAWMAEHPEKVKEYAIRHNHRRRGLLDKLEPIDTNQWQVTLSGFEHKCAYCRAAATAIDHIVPVSSGGTNHHTNLLPVCSRCNSSKNNKPLHKWLLTSKIAKEALSRPWDWEPPK